MRTTIIVPLKVEQSEVVVPFKLETDTELIPLELQTNIILRDDPHYYEGSYDVIPTEQAQTLSTADLTMVQDLVIEPIPQNYGEIVWNGQYILVK